MLASCIALMLTVGTGSTQASPKALCEMRFRLSGPSPAVEVSIAFSGLKPTPEGFTLELPDFGEWTDIDALYLRNFVCEPPARRTGVGSNRWTVAIPDGWDGVLKASYTIPLIEQESKLHERHGLLPHLARDGAGKPASAYALSTNTVMRLWRGESPVPMERTVRISADEGMSIGTGWGGLSTAVQECRLAEEGGETPILVGRPRVSRASEGGIDYEVAQFSVGDDVTGSLLALAKAAIPAYAKGTGRSIDRPVRIFIIDKGGGQWLDRACLVQKATPAEVQNPYYMSLVAHELFHQWLGGYARGRSSSMDWFTEGFTDYMANCHLAQTGLVSTQWFADRMLELSGEAFGCDAYGKAAFGDASVNWREGANETLAYKGGATLAFCLDAALHAAGKPRVAAMIGDLGRLPGGQFALNDIKAWLEKQGMGSFYAAYIEKAALPDPRKALEQAGFARQKVPLAYLGIRAADAEGQGFGKVAALDPEGPAAKAGMRVGDVIVGMAPMLSRIPETVRTETEYTFGMAMFDPQKPATIDVLRGSDKMRLTMLPKPFGEGAVWRMESSGRGFFGPPTSQDSEAFPLLPARAACPSACAR